MRYAVVLLVGVALGSLAMPTAHAYDYAQNQMVQELRGIRTALQRIERKL